MKNMAKLSLLLLLGIAQQGLEARPSLSQDTDKDGKATLKARKKLPTVTENEKEKKRVISNAIKKSNQGCPDTLALPKFELEWSSLPAVKNVTEAELTKAQHEYALQEKPVQELWKKRNEYLMQKYPVYAEEQKLQSALNSYCSTHQKELMDAQSDPMNEKEICAAEDKAQPYFWKYWQLQNQYDREHQQFHGSVWRPYLKESGELSASQIQELARHAIKKDLAPGTSLELPTLYSGNGTFDPRRVIKYSLTLPDLKEVSKDQASLRTKTITDKSKLGMPGATATTYEYTISSPRHAAPATFYVLEHRVNGDISVYAVVRITKGEDSVMPAPKNPKKAATSKPSKPAIRRETPPVPLVPVKVKKHTTGKKVAVPAPAPKKVAPSKPTKVVRKETPPVPLVPVKVEKHTTGKKAVAPAPSKKRVKKDDTASTMKN